MRRFSQHTISCLALTGLAFLPVSALAADQNTYRAGQAYLKTSAANFGQCEQQCRGDAACRGWNFIRPNPRSASGICEFNARLAAPTQSPISVSGTIATSVDPLMSRAVPAGTNTVRIGAPTVKKRTTAQQQRPTAVRRMPVPRPQQAVSPTTYKKPTQVQPNNLQPRIYGGGSTQMQAPQSRLVVLKPRIYGGAPKQASPRQTQPAQDTISQPDPSLTPEQAYYRKQYLIQKQAQDARLKQRHASIPARPVMSPQGRPAPQQRPTLSQMPAQMIAPRGPRQLPRPQMQAPQRQQGPNSLYGNLHDDLTANMTAVPRPRTAPDNAGNPDAPLATSRAVPTAIIEVAPIAPAMPRLAGG